MNIKTPKNINKKAQFLAGIGASAWFYIYQEKADILLKDTQRTGILSALDYLD